ncbi:FAD-binding and (Fe-S)-binding domain-containing protein [Homoserinimonas sp. OAct 916]|uniref:FAD-binding and (Fe-S)-binding domain-containing protein n=1 Tax=Homoserinimonas sp. OAct 916 TaxID=2211450 RepID=UPI000DBE62A8|nr:FAD-binding and (Fe-S)-binding domain-containing protein [Homoserinimonas sp. OAct 916]
MAAIRLPDPILTEQSIDIAGLERELLARVDGEVRLDAGSLAAYSTDASNYRQVPIAVVVPHTVDAAAETVAVCAEFQAPVLSRGGGTSLAGQCCNVAVVIDWSKYCNKVESIDPAARTAIVQPGVVLERLNDLAGAHGLMYGPKPATHKRCTLGGMIGNNSCGATAQAFGKTVDNLVRLEVLCYDGTRFWVGGEKTLDLGAEGRVGDIHRGLKTIVDEFGDDIRQKFIDIPRRVSGYNLDDLLPERGVDLAKMLVGSESTLVTILRAELTLVPVVPVTSTVLLGYSSLPDAADAVPQILPHQPLQLEGFDAHLVDRERARGANAAGINVLPHGDAWLMVEFGGSDSDEAQARVNAFIDSLDDVSPRPSITILDDERSQQAVVSLREDALGAAAGLPAEQSSWSGWEDAALPPARLGDYLRDFDRLLGEFGYGDATTIYGHFGQGCVHCRIPFELGSLRGVARFRQFVTRAAQLVVGYGGSLSGEHGDGQSRAELLPIMFGDRVVEAFRRTKTLFDRTNRMNPGKMVLPYGVGENLRVTGYRPRAVRHQQFDYPDDGGAFGNAALRCIGVGKCREHSGGVMCPSYRATGEEEHSTRGRARLLFEMLDGPRSGGSVQDGWRSTDVRDALDLCLSCKGCKSDCPTGVDMATYKAEFLSHHYVRRIRPAAHYSMGWLPYWARLVRWAPRLVNLLTHAPGLAWLASRVGGLEPRRPIPYFAAERFTDWYRRRGPRGSGNRGEVMLWPDTFNNYLQPAVAQSAVEVLEDAGYRVVIPDDDLCCGLTWISTGQLDRAKKVLTHTARSLAPALRGGTRLVGLEPSCTAVFRSDGPELLSEDADVALLAERTVTFAELLNDTDWVLPQIDRSAVVQPHCHQHAVLTVEADTELMRKAGIEPQTVGGCCGLAGNFGFEAGHLEVSMACAETELLPAVRAADPGALVLADGFSCRTQIEQAGVGRQGVHLAEVLAAALRGAEFTDCAEDAILVRPAPPQVLRGRPDARPFVRR